MASLFVISIYDFLYQGMAHNIVAVKIFYLDAFDVFQYFCGLENTRFFWFRQVNLCYVSRDNYL